MVDEGKISEAPDYEQPPGRPLWRKVIEALLVVLVVGAVCLGLALGLGIVMGALAALAASWSGLAVADVLLATAATSLIALVMIGLRVAWLLSDVRDLIPMCGPEEGWSNLVEVVRSSPARQPRRRRRSNSTKRSSA